jgi:hypothetical protein
MNGVSTIVVPPEVAEEKIAEYKTILKTQRRAEDVEMRRMYKAASKGKPIIDVAAAWKSTGLKDGYPRLALARGDWTECNFLRSHRWFSALRYDYRKHSKENYIEIPGDSWDWHLANEKEVHAPVPFMPPSVRPKGPLKLANYHVLFEVENWTQYPADPFLLRHITGWLFVVEAEWELTPLERSLLAGLR